MKLPFLLAALASQDISYQESSATLTPAPATLVHERMTSSGIYSFSRDSHLANMVGYAMLGEIITKAGFNPPRHLLAVQESPLKPLADHPALAKYFFDQIDLYIPDASPKTTALSVMEKSKGIIRPITWNLPTFTLLKEQGFDAELIASPFPSLSEETNSWWLEPRAVFKHSGSGTNRAMRHAILNQLDPRVPFLEITPTQSIWSEPGQDPLEYFHNGFQGMYEDVLRATTLYTYPSELVAVLITQISHRWTGEIVFLNPRGEHEIKNLQLFASLGYPYKLINLDGSISSFNEAGNKTQSRQFARSILGTKSIAQII